MSDGASNRSVPVGEIRRLGDDAVLIGVADPESARRLIRAVGGAGLNDLAEVVGGLATVLVAFDPAADGPESQGMVLRKLVDHALGPSGAEALAGCDATAEGDPFVIPCTFDGPDLTEVAEITGWSPDTLVDVVTDALLTVAVVGFAPGFAYLAGLPDELRRVPRRVRPRALVPAGSVALANGYAAVYPTASPGGWQLIGRTDMALFTPLVAPFARLAAGDRVRFARAPRGVALAPQKPTEAAVSPDDHVRPAESPTTHPVFTVEEPGVRTILQDAGRRGVAALGVPAASPADPSSFRLANQLVGNPVGAGALEITARGPTLRCLRSTFVAVVGAAPDLSVDGQPVSAGRVVPITAGQQLVVGPVRDGFRSYIAVAGGFAGPEVFQSCASDQLSKLGPGAIGRGDRLWGAAMRPPLGDHLADGVTTGAVGGETIILRVVPGPHPERFAPGTFASLASTRFTVDAESNRIGVRLRRDPSTPAVRLAPGPAVELDSQGMVTGAVQVPPDGEPVILLTDHATLGGYPVVAVVAAVDHGVLGQCAPGSNVILVPIDHDQARAARQEQRRQLEAAVVGHYPLVAG
jgi:KipI family sensor histidine kinase inhibitor